MATSSDTSEVVHSYSLIWSLIDLRDCSHLMKNLGSISWARTLSNGVSQVKNMLHLRSDVILHASTTECRAVSNGTVIKLILPMKAFGAKIWKFPRCSCPTCQLGSLNPRPGPSRGRLITSAHGAISGWDLHFWVEHRFSSHSGNPAAISHWLPSSPKEAGEKMKRSYFRITDWTRRPGFNIHDHPVTLILVPTWL